VTNTSFGTVAARATSGEGPMSTRFGRLVRFVLVIGTATSAAVAGIAPLDAAVYRTNPFETAGTVVVADGAAGSFVLDDLHRTGGNVAREADDDGRVTINVQPATRYYLEVGDSDYRKAERDEVVVDGATVFVSGKAHETETGSVFVANYVWSPPPDQGGPGTPNPTPDLPRDVIKQRSFGVRAIITEGGATVTDKAPFVGGVGWGTEVGFTLGVFEAYGTSHVEKIAWSHGDRLRMYYTPYTRYWGPSGRTERADVIRFGDTVTVTGKYQWDGTDWRFFASNVFNPPPTSSGAGGPLRTVAATPQTAEGEYDPDTDQWIATRYEGASVSPDFGGFNRALITTDLDWYWHPNAYWELSGTYTAQQEGQPSRLEGSIEGVVIPGPNPQINAVLTVDAAYGHWAGWSGDGSIRGTAQFLGDSAGGTPPIDIYAEWRWTIRSPEATASGSSDDPGT
jgi:hypothetical protein